MPARVDFLTPAIVRLRRSGNEESLQKGFGEGFGWITVQNNPVDRLTTVELFY